MERVVKIQKRFASFTVPDTDSISSLDINTFDSFSLNLIIFR